MGIYLTEKSVYTKNTGEKLFKRQETNVMLWNVDHNCTSQKVKSNGNVNSKKNNERLGWTKMKQLKMKKNSYFSIFWIYNIWLGGIQNVSWEFVNR